MKWLTSEDLKTRSPDDADEVGVRKDTLMDVEPAGERTVRFTISTSKPDRHKDTVDPAGWDLENFQNNPVVLWAHDYTMPPIARATKIVRKAKKLISTAEFPAKGVYPFADMVYELVKEGFIRGASVGFKPKTFAINEDRGGIDFTEQELLEWSIVPIPANPEATQLSDMLAQAKQAGIDLEPMRAWAKAVTNADLVPKTLGAMLDRVAASAPPPIDDDEDMANFETQAVTFSREGWDEDQAVGWLQEHGYHARQLEETDTEFRYHQQDPARFVRLRTVTLRDGRDPAGDVVLYGGPLHDSLGSDVDDRLSVLEESVERLTDVVTTLFMEQREESPESESDDLYLTVSHNPDPDSLRLFLAEEPQEPTVSVDPAVVQELISQSLASAIAREVSTLTREAIQAQRGRID
jgi:HK97 family phage prohead protease